jgi:hypothetical protein
MTPPPSFALSDNRLKKRIMGCLKNTCNIRQEDFISFKKQFSNDRFSHNYTYGKVGQMDNVAIPFTKSPKWFTEKYSDYYYYYYYYYYIYLCLILQNGPYLFNSLLIPYFKEEFY